MQGVVKTRVQLILVQSSHAAAPSAADQCMQCSMTLPALDLKLMVRTST